VVHALRIVWVQRGLARAPAETDAAKGARDASR
jgi:hypothetical protein